MQVSSVNIWASSVSKDDPANPILLPLNFRDHSIDSGSHSSVLRPLLLCYQTPLLIQCNVVSVRGESSHLGALDTNNILSVYAVITWSNEAKNRSPSFFMKPRFTFLWSFFDIYNGLSWPLPCYFFLLRWLIVVIVSALPILNLGVYSEVSACLLDHWRHRHDLKRYESTSYV